MAGSRGGMSEALTDSAAISVEAADAESVMEFTGERYLPSERGRIRYEHFHRYALAREAAAGKTILDIACGEGYGAELLAERAKRVYGVDIDSEVVAHAQRRYGDNPRLEFRTGACHDIPLPDAAVDIVVSFETIEHHDRHEEMMAEIRRVLRPGGLLILSSPNRAVYTEDADYHNPFHVRELSREELESLIRRHFVYHNLYGQSAGIGSFVHPVSAPDGAGIPGVAPFLVEGRDGGVGYRADDRPPHYFLVFASDDPAQTPTADASVYCAPWDDSLDESERSLRWNMEERQRFEGFFRRLEHDYRQLEAMYSEVEANDREKAALLGAAQEETARAWDEAAHANAETVLARDAAALAHDETSRARQETAHVEDEKADLEAQLDATRARLHRIETHPLVRVALRLRRLTRRREA